MLHGQGIYRWPDGRQYRGEFQNGVKTGVGELTWANGNRYIGMFAADDRSGLGVHYWRDGTVYRGHFAQGRMDGFGVKRLPDGELELQAWRAGALNNSKAVQAITHCQFSYQDRAWMFVSEDCINGLAHGEGVAVSLDGDLIIPSGRFVLGNLVSGSTIALPEIQQELLTLPDTPGSSG